MMLLYKSFLYCFMLLVYVTYCITSKDISPEELARRRKVAESYLSERAEAEKDWIETYHLSYEVSKDRSIITHESEQKPVMQNKRDAHFEHINFIEDSVKLHSPHFSDEKYKNHFDNSYDFSATEAESRLDKDEYARRRSIYASFIPKLATLEKEDSELAYEIHKSKNSRKKSGYSAKSTGEYKKKSTKEKTNVKKLQQLTEHDKGNIRRFEISNNNDNNELFQSHEYDKAKFSPENSQLVSESSNLKSSSNIDTISDQLKDQLIISNSITNEEQVMPYDNINNEKSEMFSKSSVPVSITEPGVIVSEVDEKDFLKKSADNGNELDLKDEKSYLNSKSEKSLANESFNDNKNISASSHMFQGNVTNNETMDILNESNMETIKAIDSDTSIKTGSANKKVIDPSNLNKRQGDVSKNTVSLSDENSDSVLKTDHSSSNDNIKFDKVEVKPNTIKNSENIKAIDSDTSIKAGLANKKVIDPSNLNKRQGDVSKNTVSLNDENSDSVLKTDHSSSNDNINFDQIRVKPETIKNSDIHNHVDLKLLQRQKTAQSYLSALKEEQKDWVETYHLSYSEGDRKKNNYFHSKNTYVSTEKIYNSLENIDVVYENSRKKICPETQYFIRWTKKLSSKFENYPVNTFSSLTFSFSDKLINHLEKLSSLEDFDITVFDELICDLISNATIHNPFHSTFSITDYIPSLSNFIKFLCVGLLIVSLIFIPYSRWLIIIIVIFAWHYIKMYQERIAEKQAIVSGVSPAHCENILTRESGIFAYIKEYFRHAWHNEDCRKYYSAIMIDPMAELSFPVVAADLVSSIMSQMLKPFGRTMNIFYKDTLSGLSWIQSLFFFVLLIVVLWFCVLFFSVFRNYRLKLPFSLGSAEPTVFSVKNRVEDVILDDDKQYLQNSPQEPCEGGNRILAEDSCKCSPMKVVENISKIDEKGLDTQDVVSVSPTKPDVSLIAYTVQGKNIIFVDKLISNEKISAVTHKLPTRMSSDNFVHDAYNSFKRRSSF